MISAYWLFIILPVAVLGTGLVLYCALMFAVSKSLWR